MIVASFDGLGIPLYWQLLDNKSGNSCYKNRIEILEKVIFVIGKERIAGIVGDREFIGASWFKYLKINNIPFCMRLPKHHLLTLKNGSIYHIECLLKQQKERYFHEALVDGIVCNVMLKKLSNNDFLFLAGQFKAKKLGEVYRKRWAIEVLFQNLKSRGFDLESTHLKCIKKLSSLLVFVCLAAAICYSIGKYYNGKVQKTKAKNHGYMAKSFFRTGLDLLRELLKNPNSDLVNLSYKIIWVFCKLIKQKKFIVSKL